MIYMINRELFKRVSKLYQFVLQIVLKSTQEDAGLPTLHLPWPPCHRATVLGCTSDGIMFCHLSTYQHRGLYFSSLELLKLYINTI